MTLLRSLAVLLLALTPLGAQAQNFPARDKQPVVDAAKLLNPEQVAQLTQMSEEIQKTTTRQFVVATIPDLEGYDIAEYGYQLGRKWGLGEKEANNGIILIVAPRDRKVRIEVGYGLEPIMTDALSSQIINQVIVPKFKAGDMPGGIVAGAQAIGEQMKLPLEAAEAKAKAAADQKVATRSSRSNGFPFGVVFWIVVALFVLIPMIRGGRRGQRYRGGGDGGSALPIILWSIANEIGRSSHDNDGGWGGGGGGGWGGGGGGGGFSGGGGSFGGGGASGELVIMRLTPEDHARVTAAVTLAEQSTDGEIVTVVAGQSDPYHDVALHWAVLATLLVVALLAWQPGAAAWLHVRLVDSWSQEVPPGWYLTIALILMAVTFLAVRILLAWDRLRMLLTPGATKTRRVQRKALQLFRTGAEKRTRAATGVLLYLSLAEHRAEILAEDSIHSRVSADVWGEAMAALIAAVRDGRPGDGMAEAVRQIGVVLAEHFPRSEGDTNELPDRLIEL